jgi:hypothetical protein
VCHHYKAFFWFQECLARSSTTNLAFLLYCLGGKVSLADVQPTPKLLNPTNGSLSRKFRDNIQAYNSMFACTSMGAKLDHSINNGCSPYIFKINGRSHHLIGEGDAFKFV